jgi:predicted phage-related endonuclease
MTNVDRRDEIEEELRTLETREDEIEHRLHELAPPATASLVADSEVSEWDTLVAEQISLITRRSSLYAEFSALISAQR